MRTIILVGGYLLDTVNHLKSLDYLAKNRVLTVKMGSAAYGLIDLCHLRGNLYLPLGKRVKTLLHSRQTGIVPQFTPDDVELAGSRAALRVDIIRLAGCSHSSTAMEQLGQPELRFGGIIKFTCSQESPRFGMFAIKIATLHHKILNDAMEQQGVVELHAHHLQEIVTMLRCFIKQCNTDITLSGFKKHFSTFLAECRQ